MKYICPLFLCIFLAPMATVWDAWSQTSNIDAEITLQDPPSSCSFTLSSNLDFGTATKPLSGSGSVTINAVTGARSVSGVTASGSPSVGQVELSGSNVSNYTVSRTFPSTLTRSGGSLSFSGSWAQSASSSSGYTAITASSYAGTAGGVGASFSRYFRFGGQASGISLSDPNGVYDGTISASATCN